MSTAFTDPTTAGFEMLKLTYANEYATALDERQRVSSWSGGYHGTFSAGTDATDVGIWAFMQDWIEDYCTEFVNIDSRTAAEDWDGEATIDNYASWTEFKTVAGLNASGWRRVTSWSGVGAPTFSYGQAQAGDIFGYWIYEDLAKAFSALIHTQFDALPQTVYTRYGTDDAGTCATLLLGWSSWAALGHSVFYEVNTYNARLDFALWRGSTRRHRALAEVLMPTTAVECEIDFYAFMEMTDDGADNEAWDDIDATGATENTYFWYETSALDNSDPRVSVGYVSAAENDPYDPQCSLLYESYIKGAMAYTVTCVQRWDFTNSDI